MSTLVIAATGHRPSKLGCGYGNNMHLPLTQLAYDYLARLGPDSVISGMALGWDQAFADAALLLGLPVHAAVPFKGQESQWPTKARAQWQRIIDRCASVTIVCLGGYHPEKMQVRNEWMVDRCDRMCALWDGSAGGTGNCIRYAANDPKVVIDNLYDQWLLRRPS